MYFCYMRIFVLDGHTLNPDDLSWAPLHEVGEVVIYPRTPKEQVVERAKNADAILVNKIVMDAPTIARLPHLKYIGLMATGFDNVDLAAAAAAGITVTNAPAYGTPAVAQHTFALMLQIASRVGIHDKSVHELEWVRNADFSYFIKPLTELKGKTLGLIGYGSISREVEKIAHAFGMQILVYSRHADSCAVGALVSLEELCMQSDIVSIHTSLTPETNELINAARLALMKDTAWLINTARGGIVNEQDLADALNDGRIAAAGLDVLSKEPPMEDNPLLTAKNCFITPHISWASKEARMRLLQILIDNLNAFVKGEHLNKIN